MWEWEAPPDDEGGGPDPTIAADIIEAQRVDLERRKEQKKIEEQINSIIDDRIAKFKNKIEIDRLSVQQLKSEIDQYGALENKLKNLVQQRKALQEAGDIEGVSKIDKDIAAAQNEANNFKGALENVAEKFLDISTLSQKAKDKINAAVATGKVNEMRLAIAEAEAEMDNFEDATNDVGKGFDFLARQVGMTSNASKTGFGQMIQGVTRFSIALAKNPIAAAASLANGLGGLLSPINILSNAIGIMVDLFKESEEAAADMTKAFGGGQAENMVILQQSKSMALEYNASLKEVAGTLTTMEGTLVGFNKSMRNQHKTLIENSLAMKKLGVDEKLLMTQTNKLRFAFGGSGGDIEKTHKRIVEFAAGSRSLGYTMNESIQVLNQFGGSVSSMGGNITTALQDMMAMAKSTGVEMNQLLTIAKKFNTFKEGADMAAKLNSVFGTSISQIELMGKTAPERNKIIANSLKNATGGYESMTMHQRLAAAEMLNFGDDVEKLRTYMHGQTDAAKAAAKTRKEQAENMEQLRQAAMSIVPTLTQLANEFKQAFVDSGALNDIMTSIINNKDDLLTFFKTAAYLVSFLANNIIELTLTYVGLKMIVASYVAFSAAYKAAAMTEITLTNIMALAKMNLGYATLFAMGGLLILVAVFYAVYKAMTKRGSPPLYLMAGVMAIGVIALGTAMYYAGPAIYPVILALALLMLSLTAVFYMIPPIIDAISGLVGVITVLFTTMVSNVGSLYLVAGGLLAIGGAFFFLGNMAMLATLGIAAGSVALLALRASMALSGTKFSDLMDIGEGVSKMGEGIKNLKEGISGLGAAGGELMKGLGDKTLMVTGDARGATVVAGKSGMFAFIPPKITVDVNMDDVEMSAPSVNVSVTLDGDELRHIISEEIASSR